MRQSPPTESSPDEFWLQHVWIGVGTSCVVMVVVGFYLATTNDEPGRGILWAALGVGVVLTTGIALLPWRRIIATGSPSRILVTWSISLVPLCVLVAALDGGTRSPATALLVLPLVFAAMAYPVRATILVGAAVITGQVVIAASSGGAGLGDVLMRVTVLVLIAGMATLIARNHQHTVAASAALAEQLRRLSRVDDLTGCLNHRGFHERLEEEAVRSRRAGHEVALLHLDLDHFKAVNDTHGHPTGDEVLATVGATLRDLARRSDVVGRLGGEEFAILLPETDLEAAEQVAERVRHAISARTSAVTVEVTASLGVATLSGAGGRIDQLIGTADRALYGAKRAGRDRVVVAGTDAGDR